MDCLSSVLPYINAIKKGWNTPFCFSARNLKYKPSAIPWLKRMQPGSDFVAVIGHIRLYA
jgi:hypothetical protein